MSTQGETLHHPLNGSNEQTWDGFSWPALFFGVIWLLIKGLYGHFVINLVIAIATAGFAVPVIWVVYGFIGNGAHKSSLLKKGYLTSEQWATRSAPPVVAPSAPLPTKKDRVTELRELAELRDKGILTDEEFNQQKAKLLGA